jgi:hypothetical protein
MRNICHYPRFGLRRWLGPILLITVGVLLAPGQFSRYGLIDLWPILLMVLGSVLLAQFLVSGE